MVGQSRHGMKMDGGFLMVGNSLVCCSFEVKEAKFLFSERLESRYWSLESEGFHMSHPQYLTDHLIDHLLLISS